MVVDGQDAASSFVTNAFEVQHKSGTEKAFVVVVRLVNGRQQNVTLTVPGLPVWVDVSTCQLHNASTGTNHRAVPTSRGKFLPIELSISMAFIRCIEKTNSSR